ncbi:MAG: hypothetical protein QXU20_04975, partial [Candidatus Woesearchaeota archaeon]
MFFDNFKKIFYNKNKIKNYYYIKNIVLLVFIIFFLFINLNLIIAATPCELDWNGRCVNKYQQCEYYESSVEGVCGDAQKKCCYRVCDDECTPNDQKCISANNYKKCVNNADSDPCYEWKEYSCGAGKVCNYQTNNCECGSAQCSVEGETCTDVTNGCQKYLCTKDPDGCYVLQAIGVVYGYKCCGNSCVDIKSNKDHCGSCNNPCKDPDHGSAVCEGGVCKVTCESTYQLCNNNCVKLDDPNNCGSCNVKCTSNQECKLKDGKYQCVDKTSTSCTEGATRCSADNSKVEKCISGSWVTDKTCGTKECCNNNACSEVKCDSKSVGTKWCDGNVLKECTKDCKNSPNTGVIKETNCPNGCENNACKDSGGGSDNQYSGNIAFFKTESDVRAWKAYGVLDKNSIPTCAVSYLGVKDSYLGQCSSSSCSWELYVNDVKQSL